ncbi:CBS domain-containing protein [Saccharomonospora amisosensis]|uniref:CBS domain-containing protein n=2 Tax=Saccharomonospora amisosensis TaxID=1128677 RepID=A0A7X5USJ2_9PSEU|nr:CBS domain-containing protein [Saccharomonospora amisosensis]
MTTSTKVRDIMTSDPKFVDTSEAVSEVARIMARNNVGALPVRGEDNRLKGIVTDRDIVVKVLAEGKDPMAVHVGELVEGELHTVRADADVEEALEQMSRHHVRRLPVMDGPELVGIVSEVDVARRRS